MNQEVQEKIQAMISDQLVISELKNKNLEVKIEELEAAVEARETQLADYQVTEHGLKKKCKKLLADGEKCKVLEAELVATQKALKWQRSQLSNVKSKKKTLKKKTQQLLLADDKCIKLRAELKKIKDMAKSQRAHVVVAESESYKLEVQLKKARAELEVYKAQMTRKPKKSAFTLPKLSLRLLTISVFSVSIITSIYIWQKAF